MVLSNSEMSKNISFHVALCAKGFNQGWRGGEGPSPPRWLFPLACHGGEGRFGDRVALLLPAKKGVRGGGRDRGQLRAGFIQDHAITF